MGIVRFLLALCVVVTHAPGSKIFDHALLSGVTAVQAFYIVSGFLITMVLNTRTEYLDVRSFYISRYLRLWPAYAVVALLVLVSLKGNAWIAGMARLDLTGAIFVVLSNCTIFFQDLYLFLAINPDGSLHPTSHFGTEPGPQLNGLLLVPQTWSIGIELTFYAIAPFICRSPTKLCALFGFGMLVRLVIGYWAPPAIDPWHYRFSPAEMTMFAAGGLAYFIGTLLGRIVSPRLLKVSGLVCVAALTAIILAPPASLEYFSRRTFLLSPPILIFVAASCPLLISFSRTSRFDSFIGELSYPMYLSHLFVLGIMSLHAPSLLASNNFAYVCATVLFSLLLFWLVIYPVDRYRRKFGARVFVETTTQEAINAPPAYARVSGA